MPVVDFEKARKKRARKRTIKRLSIMAAICGLILVLFALKNLLSDVPVWGIIKSNFTIKNGNNNFPITLADTEFYGLGKIKNNLIVKSDTDMIVYDESGNPLLTVAHGQNDPIYEIVDGDILYFSQNTKFVTVQKLYGSERKVDVDFMVADAALAKDGKVAIAGFTNTNSSVVEVYKPGEEKWVFRWHDVNFFITDVIFTPDLKGVILTMVDTRNGELYTKIQRYNLNEKDPVFEMEFDNTLVFSLEYHGNNSIIAVGDNRCISFDTKGEILGEYSYTNKPLVDFDNTEQNGAVLLLANYGANEDTSLVTLDSNCVPLMAVDTTEKVVSLKVSKNNEYLLTDSGLKWYNNKGNLIGEMNIPQNTTYLEIIDGYAYFLYANKLYKLPIKNSDEPFESSSEQSSKESSKESLFESGKNSSDFESENSTSSSESSEYQSGASSGSSKYTSSQSEPQNISSGNYQSNNDNSDEDESEDKNTSD